MIALFHISNWTKNDALSSVTFRLSMTKALLNIAHGTLFFVFDSTANANKLTDANPVPAHVSIIMDWGKDHAKENNKEIAYIK